MVDHDSVRLVWAHPGRNRATVRAFFDALEASGASRCARITHVTADGAPWIADVVRDRCPCIEGGIGVRQQRVNSDPGATSPEGSLCSR